MAAQGYQESQLDQSARSPVGAIGVMQIMPATGKELDVGDITQEEPNINAGIKYMRYMIDQFFENEPMTKLDKALFAFASYNAGPGRVAQLRKAAAKRGLDPNIWFHNVEYVAAERIGQETVTYVANIYKYYIAYRLILDSQRARCGGGEGQGREAVAFLTAGDLSVMEGRDCRYSSVCRPLNAFAPQAGAGSRAARCGRANRAR